MKNGFFTFILFFSITTANAQQAYFVDGTNGNDANNGTTLITAWKTIQNAFDKATAGSIVYIKGGTYNKQLTLNVSGTVGSPIEFRNYQNDSVYIDGAGLSANPMLDIEDQSNIIFRNLIIQNLVKNNAVGIQIVCSGSGTVQNLVFKNLIIRNINWTANASTKPSSSKNSQPFIAYGEGTTAAHAMTNILVDSCTLYNNITGFSESLSFGGNISGITITNNLVHDNTNIGIDVTGNYNECQCNDTAIDHSRNAYIANNICYNNVSNYATSGGIYVDGAINVLIEKNITHHNGYGIELGCEQDGSSYGLTVRDNLIYDNQIAGMAIGGYDISTTGIVSGARITNNTFVSNNYANDGTGELDITKVSDCIIKNNIFYTNAQNQFYTKEAISPQTNLVFDYNNWFTGGKDSNTINVDFGNTSYSSFTAYKTGSGFDKHSIFTDPLFNNNSIANPDFYLQATSPDINRGDAAFVIGNTETDFNGNSRIVNSIIDIGAYEYSSGTVPVRFIALNAVKNIQDVLVSWSTENEVNNASYEVQKSMDGINFSSIGTVVSHPYSSIRHLYDFIDKAPVNGFNYYRIKQLDITGAITYTNIVSVNFETESAIAVQTLIVNENIQLRNNGIQTNALLYTSTGQLCKTFQLKPGSNTLNVPFIAAGIYYLSVNNKLFKLIR